MSTSKPNDPQGTPHKSGDICPPGMAGGPGSSGSSSGSASTPGQGGSLGASSGSAGSPAGAGGIPPIPPSGAGGMGSPTGAAGSSSLGGSSTGHSSGPTNRLQQKAGDLRHDLEELGTAARDAAQERLENLRHTATDYLEQGRERVNQMEQQLETQIREQPLRSLLIASGIGFLCGVLMRR